MTSIGVRYTSLKLKGIREAENIFAKDWKDGKKVALGVNFMFTVSGLPSVVFHEGGFQVKALYLVRDTNA